jgi:hypothetical protein
VLALRRLGLVLLVFGILLAGCGTGLAVTRQSDVRPTDVTARTAFRAAAQVGRAWRSDARLVLVSTSWQDPSAERLRTGRGAWAFYFVSGDAALVVTVADGRAEAGPETALGADLDEVVFLDWKVDSDGAIEAFLRAGGEAFLKDRPGASLTVRLLKSADRPVPEWRITALDSGSGHSLQVWVDAATGAVVGSGSGGGR